MSQDRRSLLQLLAGLLPSAAFAEDAFAQVVAGLPANSPERGQPLIVLPGSVRAYRGQQGREADLTELLATREQTGGAYGIFRQTIVAGSGPPLHLHHAEDEFAAVLSGEFQFKLGDQAMRAPVGSFISIPRKTSHTYKNVGSGSGVLLFGVTPGGFEGMFAEREGVDPETNLRLMKKYHMEVVGPPLV